MPKPKRTLRPVEKSISLPEDLVAKVDLLLYSEFEQRVPHGAWARLVNGLLTDWLAMNAKEVGDERQAG